MEFNFQNF